MQVKKVFRGMLIALPVVTMMACSTTDEAAMSEAAAQQAAAEQAEKDRIAREQAASEERARVERLEREEATRLAAEKEALLRTKTVYFDFDRSNVSSDFYSVLNEHAAFLAANPGQSVTIEGHCDSRGTPEYNIALGERRAKAIETYLLNEGVNASQISVVSYGEEKPEVMGSSEDAFAKNRRGVLVYQ